MAHRGTNRLTAPHNITRQTHRAGCKIRPYQWILAIQGHLTVDEEEGATLEEEGANTDSTTTNLPTVSKITPQLRGIHRTPASNVGKWDTMPENALRGKDARKITGKIKRPI